MNDSTDELVERGAIKQVSIEQAVDGPLVAWMLGTGYAANWTWRLARISAEIVSRTLHYSELAENNVISTPR
jgi:hypothetical protein